MPNISMLTNDVAKRMNEKRLPYEVALKEVLEEYGNESAYQRIHREAQSLMSATPGLRYGDAVQRVTEKNPDLYKSYAIEVRGDPVA